MTLFKARPVPPKPIGQVWHEMGKESLADLAQPTPCPLCGTIDCGVDTHVTEQEAAAAVKAAEFERIDREREERARDEERARIAADPDYGRPEHW